MTDTISSFSWYSMSDLAIVTEIGIQLKKLRLQQNITQQNLARRSGLSRATISDLENGKAATSFITIVQVLRSLGRLELLNQWLVSDQISPLAMAGLQRKPRLKASPGKTNENRNKEDISW